MSEVIQLNHQAENIYEFDLEVEGLLSLEVKAWFVIVVKNMELSFPCVQNGNHFTCTIPPMPFVERTSYRGVVRLVADDYFFEVVSDLLVNVIGDMSFTASDMKNMTVRSTIQGQMYESKLEPVKDSPDKQEPKGSKPDPELKSKATKDQVSDTKASPKSKSDVISSVNDGAPKTGTNDPDKSGGKTEPDTSVEDHKSTETKEVENKIQSGKGESPVDQSKRIIGPSVKTDVKRVETSSDIASRIMNDVKASNGEQIKTPSLKDTAISDTTGKPTKKKIETQKFKTPNTPKPEDSNAGIPSGYDKKTQPTKDEMSTADKKNQLIKDVIIKQTKEIAKESDENHGKFTKKGDAKPETLQETSKDDVIESVVSDFVAEERTEREEKLRSLLKDFTVDPDSTPDKTRFIRKS